MRNGSSKNVRILLEISVVEIQHVPDKKEVNRRIILLYSIVKFQLESKYRIFHDTHDMGISHCYGCTCGKNVRTQRSGSAILCLSSVLIVTSHIK